MATRRSDAASFVEREWKPVFDLIDNARHRRGKAMFKQGGVQQVRIQETGFIEAKVKSGGFGSGGSVHVRVPCIDWWERFQSDVALWLSRRPDWLANVLSGVWDIEFIDFLHNAGLKLFPDAQTAHRIKDESVCTCGDWEKPCQHVAAVLYRIIADVSSDSMKAFEYVGLERTTLLDEVHRHTAKWLREEKQNSPYLQASDQFKARDYEDGRWSEERTLTSRGDSKQESQTKSNQIIPDMSEPKLREWQKWLCYTADDGDGVTTASSE